MTLRDHIVELLRCALAELTRPGELYISVTQGEDMTEFQVRVLLPATRPGDRVTAREMTVTIDGGTPAVATLAADAAQFDVWAPEDSTVKFSLVDLDAKGNRSTAREREAAVTDTVAPAQPGELAITTIDQRETPDAPQP